MALDKGDAACELNDPARLDGQLGAHNAAANVTFKRLELDGRELDFGGVHGHAARGEVNRCAGELDTIAFEFNGQGRMQAGNGAARGHLLQRVHGLSHGILYTLATNRPAKARGNCQRGEFGFEFRARQGHQGHPRQHFIGEAAHGEVFGNDRAVVDHQGVKQARGEFGLGVFARDRDADRVNVSRLPASAVALPAMTGGFIVSIDKGAADFAGAGRWLQFVYPSGEDMARAERKAQLDYITGFIDSFGQAVSAADFRHPVTGQHYSEFIDVESWIDHHIINTLAKNPDGMRFSTYFHKDRGGRLAAGPVWDFDRSFGTPYDPHAIEPEEWVAWSRGGQNFADGWWGMLFGDPAFRSRYQSRFKELLNQEFSADSLERIVDGLAAEVGEAADRNFRRWTWSPPLENSHASEIALLKNFLRRRVTWIKSRLETDF